MEHYRKFIFQLNSSQIIILGFAAVILAGAGLLMLPIATVDGNGAVFTDALFTSVSAVCVTGLVVQDTATYWSAFGQIVILGLIQIGGLGVVTAAITIAHFAGRKIGLRLRFMQQDSAAASGVTDIVKLAVFILKFTAATELIGAVLLYPVFRQDFGAEKGAWYAIFHSISAYCNAGFDLMGVREKFSSLTSYAANPLVSVVIMALIIAGGLGFTTWDEIRKKKWNIRSYRIQSKLILFGTLLLILVPTVLFMFLEMQRDVWSSYSMGEKWLISFFQAVTPRTAGFNTVDYGAFSESGQLLVVLLMLIGGAPGSTAGGMKVTTFLVLLCSAGAVFLRKHDTVVYKRRIAEDIIRQASAILLMYLILFAAGSMIIARIEQLPLMPVMFETASALGTVGLSLGLTPGLHMASRWILIAFMYFGRVGGLTILFAALTGKDTSARFPSEKIAVG